MLLKYVAGYVAATVGLNHKKLRAAHRVERNVHGCCRRRNEGIPARWRRDVEASSEVAGLPLPAAKVPMKGPAEFAELL